MEQGNQRGNHNTDNTAENQRKSGDHRSSLTFLCTQALGNQDSRSTRDDAEHQVADRNYLIGSADGTGSNVVITAEHKNIDEAQQHKQHILNKDRPGKAQ